MNIEVKGPRPFKPGLAVASVGADERRVRKETVRAIHIKDEFFRTAEEEFDHLLKAVEDDEPEMPSFVLRGPTGAGKSHILRHLMTDERLKPGADDWGEYPPFPIRAGAVALQPRDTRHGDPLRADRRIHEHPRVDARHLGENAERALFLGRQGAHDRRAATRLLGQGQNRDGEAHGHPEMPAPRAGGSGHVR